MAKRLASGLKAKRQAKKRTIVNTEIKIKIKKELKKLSKLTTGGDLDGAKKIIPNLFSLIDKAAKKGVLHKNTAARRKAKAARLIK